MSRIGNRELKIFDNVEAIIKNNLIIIKGPKGELQNKIPKSIKININNNLIKVERINNIKHTKQLHGTINALIKNMIEGVVNGFKKELEINGIGYKAILKEKYLVLNIGKSHVINYLIPEGIKIYVPKPTSILIEGICKQLVGEVAANIRKYKKPEPYKGKGIKYKDEIIIRKEGKSSSK